MPHPEYEVVVGLEVHAQLLTRSKLFAGDATTFGEEPNSNISAITLAHPGTLPKINRKAIEHAVKLGIALGCNITTHNYFARKNYFYPDLPKGYQVSQHTTPICTGGAVKLRDGENSKLIRLNRIHIEEDAGKSLHDVYPDHSVVDHNRAGVGLLEIVTEPDIRSSDDAYVFITELRKLVRYLDICDGNMEEGSMRCDANISVRKKGDGRLGTRVEVKNLNSIRNVKRAIEAEADRLIGILRNGSVVEQQTRSFDADKGVTFATREKEEAADYRYFPEPDLTPFHITDEFIARIKSDIPVLQEERMRRYTEEFQLPLYDAQILTEDKAFADYFESITKNTANYKAAANWMLGPIRSWMNEHSMEIDNFPLKPLKIAELIVLIDGGKVSFSTASSKLLPLLVASPETSVDEVLSTSDLSQVSERSAIEPIVDEVLERLSSKVAEYKKGKKGLLALFVGEVIKKTKGKADPKIVNQIISERLK